MSTELALVLFAGITIAVQVLLHLHTLKRQNKSDSEIRYRAALAEIKDAAFQMVQLRHRQMLGDVTLNTPEMASTYSLAMARLHTGAIRIKDQQLDDAISTFVHDDFAYRDKATKHGIGATETSVAGGGFELSYMAILVRCNELDPIK